MSIELSTLPSTVLDTIPITLRWNRTTLVYNDLPADLQISLRQYVSSVSTVRVLSGVYDYNASFSEFSDFQEITSLTVLIQDYAINWLQIKKGAYPFDPFFGTILYSLLHTKDTQYRNQLISNELDVLVNMINNEFSVRISVVDQSITPVKFADHTEYELFLSLSVLGNKISISLNV